jgi:hypothetical protein
MKFAYANFIMAKGSPRVFSWPEWLTLGRSLFTTWASTGMDKLWAEKKWMVLLAYQLVWSFVLSVFAFVVLLAVDVLEGGGCYICFHMKFCVAFCMALGFCSSAFPTTIAYAQSDSTWQSFLFPQHKTPSKPHSPPQQPAQDASTHAPQDMCTCSHAEEQ